MMIKPEGMPETPRCTWPAPIRGTPFPAFAGLLPEAAQAIERADAWLDQRYPAARSPAQD